MADDFWFFLSYARIELDVHIRKFRQELAALVRSLGGVQESDDRKVGFLDINNIEHGRDWTTDMTSALQTSRVLVPLYSPLYFQRDYCGKEFQVFRNPGVAHQARSALPPVRAILPVIFYPVPMESLADSGVNDIQLFEEPYPEIYRQKGLHFLMDTPGHESEYKEFLRAFAERVVAEAKKVAALAASGSQLKPLDLIPPAFPAPKAVPEPVAQQVGDPPIELKFAAFVCSAARNGEIARQVAAYGPIGGIDWKPFAPLEPAEGAFIAQSAALQERFLSEVRPLDQNLSAYLKDAEDRQLIVVVLVDPWSLTNPKYRQWIAPCDEFKPSRAIIVAWNLQDAETKSNQPALIQLLQQTLPTVGVAIRHPVYFRDSVDSRERLQTEIQSTLTELYMRLLQARAAKLGLTAQPPPSVSNAQGVANGV